MGGFGTDRNVGIVALVTVALVLAMVPAAWASHGAAEAEVVICGVVENPVDWDLEGITVTAVGRGTTSFDHAPAPRDFTEADGSFEVVTLGDRYEVLVVDNRTVDERDGAAYLPVRIPVAAHLEAESGACGADQGVDLDTITLSAPANGFLEIQINDKIAGDPLPDGSAAVLLPAGLEYASTETDGSGLARLACPAGITVDVAGQAPQYGALTVTGVTCPEAGVTAETLELFRTPVPLKGTVNDATAGGTLGGAQVSASPQTLALPSGHPYTLDTTSASDGSYELELPWGDTYDVTADAQGYASSTEQVTVQRTDGFVTQAFSLDRLVLTLAGTVTDLAGNGLAGASLTFEGATLDAPKTTTTGTSGGFSLALAQGTYSLDIVLTGYNTRSCTVELASDGTVTYAPDRCLTLLSDGKGAVEGTVLDQVTGSGIQGASVSSTDGSSTTAGTGGAFAMEVMQDDWKLTLADTGFTSATRDISVPLDGFVDLGDTVLDRTTVTLTVTAKDSADGATLDGAKICIAPTTDSSTDLTQACQTDSTGDGAVKLDVLWSARSDGSLDAGNYDITGERTDAAPVYDEAVCQGTLEVTPSDASLDCDLVTASQDDITVGPLLDAHTGAPVAGVDVQASSTKLPASACAAPYTCKATTGSSGMVTLTLPNDERDYTITIDHDDYQTGASATGILPGETALKNQALARTSETLEVSVFDAHSGFTVSGAEVSVQDTTDFVCDAGAGGFTCQTTTAEDGIASLTVPWGTLDVATLEGNYDVPRNLLTTEEGVAFQAALGSLTISNTDAGDSSPSSMELKVLRGLEDPIFGVATDHLGTPVVGATVDPDLDTADLICDPADHDVPSPVGFDCDGTATETGGAYSLALPDGNLEEHTWSLTATHPSAGDFFQEQAEGVPGGSEVDFTFWPTSFTLVVEPRDAVTGELIPFASACLRNLDEVAAHPLPLEQETCQGNLGEAAPIVFKDLPWQRADQADETDQFLLRSSAPDYLPAIRLAELGPQQATITVLHTPLLPTAQAGLIQGTVTDGSASGSGIAGMLVTATRQEGGCASGQATFHAVTGPGGVYAVTVPCTGTFTVEADDATDQIDGAGDGLYEPDSATVTVEPVVTFSTGAIDGDAKLENAVTVDLELTRRPTNVRACVITASPSGPPGSGLEGATIQATGQSTGTTATLTTGEDGCAASEQVPWDLYILEASHPDCGAISPAAAPFLPVGDVEVTLLCVADAGQQEPCFPLTFTQACKDAGGPSDSDGDGWSDRQEEELPGMDPADPNQPGVQGPIDSDFDLVPDVIEQALCQEVVVRAALGGVLGGEAGTCEERGDGSFDYVPPEPLPPEPPL